MFDLHRPDAEPQFFHDSASLSHDGNIKSVAFVNGHTGVSAGDDGRIKSVIFTNLQVPLS